MGGDRRLCTCVGCRARDAQAEGGCTVVISALFSRGAHEQQPAYNDRSDTGPDRQVDPFLLLDLEFNWADLGSGLLLGVREAAVDQAKYADDNHGDGGKTYGIHGLLPSELVSAYPQPTVGFGTRLALKPRRLGRCVGLRPYYL